MRRTWMRPVGSGDSGRRDVGKQFIDDGGDLETILDMPAREKIARAKFIPEESLEEFDGIEKELAAQISEHRKKKEEQ